MARTHPHTHTHTHTHTLRRTPLDKEPARYRHLYLTKHNTHKRKISIPQVGFEPAVPRNRAAADSCLWPGCHGDRYSRNQYPLVPYAASTDPFCNEDLAFPLKQSIDFSNITYTSQHMAVWVLQMLKLTSAVVTKWHLKMFAAIRIEDTRGAQHFHL